MKKTLNITNGDCAANIMREANIEGVLLPWRDVLHEGPVPDLSLDKLSLVRARYIAKQGWGTEDKISQSFQKRNRFLTSHLDYRQIILWFEHDLYDQLQLIQILAWFNNVQKGNSPLALICVDRYLGRLTAGEMYALLRVKTPVTKDQLSLAARAWSFFCNPNPTLLSNLLIEDTSALPYLDGAIRRLLQEYPNEHNGLSRTAHTLLELVDKGCTQPADLFARYSLSEERQFMGDASFWNLVVGMLDANPPLVALPENVPFSMPACADQALTITETGKDVLAGDTDATDCFKLDRWIGGVHLTPNNDWRWNTQKKVLNRRLSG